MRINLQEIVTHLKKHTGVILCGGIGLVCLALYIVAPQLLMPRPKINEVTPSEIMRNSIFNADKSITLIGENFSNLIGIYINGIWEPACEILTKSNDSVVIRLPDSYYLTAGNLSIQVQTKINGDLFAKSNGQNFRVLSDSSIKVPKITMVSPEKLSLGESLIQPITISGENLTENSAVMINGALVQSFYDNGSLKTSALCSDLYLNGKLSSSLQIVQLFNGYPTSVKSPIYYWGLDSSYNIYEDEERIIKANHDFMLEYLSTLRNEKYIVVFAVCDESSSAVSDELVSQMNSLGLEQNLASAGLRNSYIAVLDGFNLIHEAIGTDALVYDNEELGVTLHIESANFNVGNRAVIQINGVDYAVNTRGLNIAVYDKELQRVIDSVSFDTYSGLNLSK